MRLNIAHQLSSSSALNASISGCIRAIQQIKPHAISTSHRSDRAALYQTISCGRSPFLKLNWLFRYSCNIASFLIAFNKPSSTFFWSSARSPLGFFFSAFSPCPKKASSLPFLSAFLSRAKYSGFATLSTVELSRPSSGMVVLVAIT